MTTSTMAWVPLSIGFQSKPMTRSGRANVPRVGWKMKNHNTPAIAGATA